MRSSQVVDQARRRVLDGEQVTNAEKIYSIFKPHTDLIKRGKVRTPVEFGHKVFLAESAKGLITQYEVLKGNRCDEVHVAPSLKRHRRAFGRAPKLYTGAAAQNHGGEEGISHENARPLMPRNLERPRSRLRVSVERIRLYTINHAGQIMRLATLTVRVATGVKKRLERLAKSTGRSRSFLAAEAINEYLEVNEWQVTGIKRAIASLDHGKRIPHYLVKDWVASWGGANEKPVPKRS
jgi:predicted transcriptional regulator